MQNGPVVTKKGVSVVLALIKLITHSSINPKILKIIKYHKYLWNFLSLSCCSIFSTLGFTFVFFFDIIASFLVQFFNINQAYSFFLSNILDMTVATRFYFSFNRIINIFLYCFFNAFLGISIHLQIISVTNYLNYTSFLLKRSIIGLISGIIVVILYYNF